VNVYTKQFGRGYLVDTLVKGILVLIPLAVILFLLNLIFNIILNFVSPMSSLMDPGEDSAHWIFKLISLVILFLFILGIGATVKHRRGRIYFQNFEKRYLLRIPLYNVVLETVNQFIGLKKMPFSEVVLIDPFETGATMTGFITDNLNEELYTVFVPTAPNPTNGFIYHVRKDQITFLDVSPEQAMRTVVGMGTGTADLISSDRLKRSTHMAPAE